MAAEPITAGGYLRQRREAAGLTLRQVAQLYAYNNLGAPVAEMMLAEAESGVTVLGEPALRRLREIFQFDVGVHQRLADGLPPPDLCATCGCSWDDPCNDDGRGCAWANRERTLCSVCANKALAA